MARDKVTIGNLALSFIGDSRISDIEEDSKPAREIRPVWDEVRRFVLGKGEWNFAMRRKSLSARPATVTNPVIGYENAFPLPSDCRRFVEIIEPRQVRDCYANEAGEILANTTGPLVIRYVRDVVEPALWSDGFVEAFAFRLAWQICDALAGEGKGRKEKALKAYKEALKEAKGDDAKQNPPRAHVETDWVRERFTGSSAYDRLLEQGRH